MMYEDLLDNHLDGGPVDVPGIYHSVRKIPYGSTGERDPAKVIENNFGSCSGKHILLRDLLRKAGKEAETVTMFTHFNRGIPSHPAMPGDLRAMIDDGDVCDFHHYVRVFDDGHWLKLDATWNNTLIPFGFPVNENWNGGRDTILAATPIKEYPPVEDLAAFKTQLLAELDSRQSELRLRFFRRLTEWMMTL